MARFRITWPTGEVTEVEQSDCNTVEQYVNCRFGAGVEPAAKVELVQPEVTKPAPSLVKKKADANK